MTEFTRGRVDHVGHDAGIEKLTKGLSEFLFGFQLIDHRIEGGGEIADLVPGGDGQGIRVLSIGGFMKCGSEASKCGGETTGDEKKNKEPKD